MTDLPTVTVTAAGPFGTTSGIQNMTASPAGGMWTADCGTCINSTTGAFNPATAGERHLGVCYAIGTSPCIVVECIDVIVSNLCLMTATASFNDPTCFGFNDGSVTVNSVNANGSPDFVITNSGGTVVNTTNSNTANNLVEGWYYFSVTDDLGCVIIDSVLLEDQDKCPLI